MWVSTQNHSFLMYNTKMSFINKSKKYTFSVLVSLSLLLSPLSAFAVVPPLLGFGGRSVGMITCTCSFAGWKYFFPLYLTSIPMTGPMVVSIGTFPFLWYTYWLPGVSHAGAYIAGVQACWIYAGYFCFPLPSVGVMAFTGSSLFR